MRLWSKIHQCMVDTCGVFSDGTLACITDAGQWVHLPQSDLSRNPDMSLTVGHIIDNPTFPFDADIEVTETDEYGNVVTLWDDQADGVWENNLQIPAELLVRRITYMVLNTEKGRLRIEVG